MRSFGSDTDTVLPVQPVGSQLCLRCGLCCQGAVHYDAVINPDEIAPLEALGFQIVQARNGAAAFSLPCHHLADLQCTIYDIRPSPCRSFECKLLTMYLNGQATLEYCVSRVELARQLLSQIMDQLGVVSPGQNVWSFIKDAPEPVDRRQEVTSLLLNRAVFFSMRKKYFISHRAGNPPPPVK